MRAQHGPALSLVGLFCVSLLTACGGGGGGGGSPNKLPTADAGNDITVRRNATVSLDGSGSADSDGDALAYRWTQTSGAPVTLSSNTSARPTFTAPNESGTVTFSLVASDGKADSSSDTVSVTVENLAPTAASVGTITAGPGTVAMLDGSASVDPDGDPLTYSWTQLSGPAVTIDTVAPGVTRFQVPSTTPVTLVFALTVSDGEATSVTINVIVNVIVVTLPNQAPVVSAGTNFAAPRRATVVLNGWGYDPDTWGPLTYSWEQTAGPPVTLAGSNTATPSFTAPETPAQLTFVLRGSDGILTSSSAVTVNVQNFAPNVYGAAITPNIAYTTHDLSIGAQFSDPDNDSVTTSYEWLRNGVPIGSQTANIFPASLTTKNDVITARITADDGLEQATVEVSTTILDSPGVLAAQSPPPTALNYGDTASFTVSATDADGDAIPGFEVAFGPAGFAVTSQGVVTWTASGPLFDQLTDFNWGVRVAGDTASLLSGTFAVTDAAREYPLRRTGVQIPVQHSGLKIGDLDGDGDSEMLVGSSQTVYVLSRSGADYQQSWVYPFDVNNTDYSNVVRAVAAGDVDSDGRQEIFFSKGAALVRLDGISRREAARNSLRCRALELADLDANGAPELVCLAAPSSYYYDNPARLVVMNPSTMAEIWSTAELPLGYTFAIGNVDNDAALEIVADGGFVFDGQTHQNQWVYSQAFGAPVDTGDMDGDGVEEIVALAGGTVRAYSAVHHSPLWEYVPSFSDLATLVVADANGDGVLEAIAGNGQWGNVMGIGYNTATHQAQLLWQIDSQEHGVTSIAVGDVDNDGVKEVVWGSGATSSGRDDFVVAGFTPTISVKWQSSSGPQLDGGFYGGALARIGAGASRLMFASPSTNSGYAGTRAIALDPLTGEIEVSASELGSNWAGARAFDVADYDNDNVDELFLGTAALYNGYFAAYDFAADSIEWQSPQGSNSSETSSVVTHADMNGDGHADLIGLTTNGYIHVYDVRAQTLLWKSTGLGGGTDLAVADLDDDGEQEIVAAVYGRVVVYGRALLGTTYLERASVMDSGISDLVVGDLDDDDQMEIYALHSDYSQSYTTLNVFDADLHLVRAVPLGVRANSIFIEDSTFARKNLLIATGDGYSSSSQYELWAVDPVTGADVWHSPSLVGSILPNSLQFVDTDGDGDKEITFGTNFGMHFTR